MFIHRGRQQCFIINERVAADDQQMKIWFRYLWHQGTHDRRNALCEFFQCQG